VTAAEAPVREGPEEALRPVVTLGDGSEVRVIELRGAAARVRLASGVEGWIALAAIERL
jgi:hypothetical protein